MRKFYFDDLYDGIPTDTFAKIDKMFDEMFKPAIENMKSDNHKVIVIDSLPELYRLLEEDAAKSCKQKQTCEDGKVGEYKSTPICFDIQSITANHKKNAFTVVWGDGSHTIIHLQPGDIWDDEKALAMCFVKHMMGDKGNFNDIFTEELPAKIKHIGKNEPIKVDVSNKENTEYGRREEGLSPAVEKLMKTCQKAGIDLKKAGESANETAKATITLNDSLTSMLEKFLSTSDPVYNVYLRRSDKDTLIMSAANKNAIGNYLKMYIQKNYPALVGTPWRIWNHDKKNLEMYIDFGASEYFVIPSMTCEEWNKNN